MAITIPMHDESAISLEQYVDYVEREVDIRDFESVLASGRNLRRLSMNKELVPNIINEAILGILNKSRRTTYTPQSFIIAKTSQGYVRGNIWPKVSISEKIRSREAEVYSYLVAHDHSFDFVTCGYFGPGYTTRIYEVEPNTFLGVPGAKVAMKFLEETSLPMGKVMVYRAHRDVHIQYPPPSLTVSLNLMCCNANRMGGEQHFFDISGGTVTGNPDVNLQSRRAKLVELAALVGDDITVQLLLDVVRKDTNHRVRAAAIKGFVERARDGAEVMRRVVASKNDRSSQELLRYIDLLSGEATTRER
jgi:hypothetical protein